MLHRSVRPSRSRSSFRLFATLAVLVSCTGCPLVGVIADKVGGRRPVEPLYEPGKTTQLLVIAENYRTPTQSASDSDRLARLITDELTQKQVAVLVSQEKLALVREARQASFTKMSVVDVAKAVGAQQVLYIDLGGIGVGAQQGSDMLKGVGHASVKVIDVAAGDVAFPKDMSEGMPVSYETPIRRATDVTTPDAVRNEAIVGLSGKIARMFYQYQPSDIEAIDTGH
jgi:hypothetical protein